MKKFNILVTGGCGYIGSHITLQLLFKGHTVIVIDNLSNSTTKPLNTISKLTKRSIPFYNCNLKDTNSIINILKKYSIDCVIHCAGLKAVGESQKFPLSYFEHNIAGSVSLFKAMEKANVFNIVFSSSATVYGENNPSPYQETMPTGMPNNNYGYTKLIIEQMLEKLAIADDRWSVALLRYFNPVGAHQSGKIGEDPQGIPNNLMPYVTQVAIGKREKLSIFGNDYNTPDGTCIRDYIHVVDLADAHISVLDYIMKTKGCDKWNIGTNKGYSVLNIIKAFELVTKIHIPYSFVKRRDGDLPIMFCDNSKAKLELNWFPKYNLNTMIKDSFNYVKNKED